MADTESKSSNSTALAYSLKPQGGYSTLHDDDEEDVLPSEQLEDVTAPTLIHRFRHDRSILALAATEESIYAGTQGGDILVFSLSTWERIHSLKAHRGSVLGLCLAKNDDILISSAGDRFVNVWTTAGLKHIASIYSVHDVGDIFCVSYSGALETIYFGCQNTSIQWHSLKELDTRPVPGPGSLFSFRRDKFFDSLGPGGIRSPSHPDSRPRPLDCHTGRLLEIESNDIHQFAHFGYVYCMLLVEGNSLNATAKEVLISGGGDGAIRLWTMDEDNNGRIVLLASLQDSKEETESVLTIAVEGAFLFSGHIGGEIRLWDLESKQLLRVLQHSDEDILSLTIGPAQLFCTNVIGEVIRFDQTFELVRSWSAHGGRVLASSCARSSGRQIFMTGSSDDSIAVWDAYDPKSLNGEKIHKHYDEEMVESLQKFVSFRTVSSDPRYKADCYKGASYLRSVFKQFGAATEMLKSEINANPVVFARFRGTPRANDTCKRVLFYGHYDVIAAENKHNLWLNDPFELAGVDGYLYGRGATDNKGPTMAAIYAVADLAMRKLLTCDVTFLIEGEEENGSIGFDAAVKSNKILIGNIDWILLANSYWLDDEMPCITYGLRGVIHATIEVESDQPDLHSGVDGSRLLDEPLKDLVMLTARLSGPHGAVQIPGFYERILPITHDETRLYNEIARMLLDRDPSLGSAESLTKSLMQRWRDASLTIHGFKTSGSEKSTIIPRHASVAISFRLVPDQNTDVISTSLVTFLKKEFAAFGSKNNLTVKINHMAEPWLGDTKNILFQTLERAVVDVWSTSQQENHRRRGSSSNKRNPSHPNNTSRMDSTSNYKHSATTSSTLASSSAVSPERTRSPSLPSGTAKWKPLYIREGGSIPAIRFLEKEFNAPAAHLPCGQASDNAHLDNERIRVVNLLKSREVFRRVFLGLGE